MAMAMASLEVGLKACISSSNHNHHHHHRHSRRISCSGVRRTALNQKASGASAQIVSEEARFLEAAADPTRILSSPPTFGLPSLLLDRDKVTPTVHEVVESVISGAGEAGLTDKEKSLRRSLRERRETVQELLMEALKAQKLGPTFCTEMVRNMPEFVDHVMIESAALRKTPQYVNAPFSYRVRIYIEQCRVAKTIRWLKHKKFPVSKIGKLIYMVEDHEGNLQAKVDWFRGINLRGKELAAVLMREPHMLEIRISGLQERVEILLKSGVRSDWVGWVVRRSPKVFACSKEELEERIRFYTDLGVVGDQFGTMVYNFPACLGHFSLEEMHTKLNYLRSFGLDDENLGKALACKPQLIACDIEEGWKPLVKLLYYLGVDGYGLRKILVIQPSVFCLSLTNNIAPKVRFLRDVGVKEETIGDVLVKYPPLLSYSLDKKIRPLVMFLLETAGVPIQEVGKVLSLQPELIGCSLTKKLEVIAKFFLYHGMKREELGMMVADFPMVLKYSLSTLKPKLKYIVRVMELPLKEVIKFPRVFSYSLEARIAPRHRMLTERGLKHFDLRSMLACSDDEFMQKLEKSSVKHFG